MSVVELSADAWQASAPGLGKGLASRIEAVDQLRQGLEVLAGSGRITGEGADAMRAYIREVHGPILQCLLLNLTTFRTAIGVYWAGYRQVDADGNFRLVHDELDTHLTRLAGGMQQLRGFATELRRIAGDASHLLSLGGAGAAAADQTVDELERIRSVVKTQKDTWEAYEGTDHGFGQVRELTAQLHRIVGTVGKLTVGQGRSYVPGSFTATMQGLGPLTVGMVQYCQDNQDAATRGWESMFSAYAEDVDRARREKAGWDLIWDGVQIVAGAVVTAIGLGLTPFTGGVSLGLTLLGGSLLIGGINSAINHASIATTGQELNLADMAAQWIDTTVAKPVASWGGGWEFAGGFISGAGHALTGMAGTNVHEMVEGATALITDQSARDALWEEVTGFIGQIGAGNPFAMGQAAGEIATIIIPGAAAARATRTAGLIGKIVGEADTVGTRTAREALSEIPRVSAVGDTVIIDGIKKMSASEWSEIYESSVHNPSAPEVTLGKWEGADNPDSYTNQAITAGNEYFDLGASWDTIKAQYELTDGNMFDLFNRPFLDKAIEQGKPFHFTHDPRGDKGALGGELEYLKSNGYAL